MTRARNVGQEPGPSTGQARADADPNSVTPVDVDTQLYLRLMGLLKISQMTAAEIVDVALRVTATAIESALLMHTEGRVTTEMIEKELGKQAKKKHTSMLEDDETDEEMIARMRQAKRKGHVTYADDVDDEEIHLGAKLLTTLQSILTPPKEAAVAVPRALQAALESVSGGEMALPLPVGVVHRMIGRFMQKYGLKKHVTSKGVPPDNYCRYCSALVNLKEQEKGIFCCEDARRLKDICKEWKQCVLSIRGSAGLTEAQGVGRKKSQLPDEIREAKTRELKGPKEDQSLKPGTSRAALGKDASSVKVKEQERMKLEKIKDETSELAPRRVCSKITAKAQQEKFETQKGLTRGDSETASKTLRAGATDDQVLEKRGQKRDARDTGKSETRLGTAEDEMYKSKDAIGKSLKPGTSRAALGKDASSVKVKEQERMKLEKIKDETSELGPRRECSKITAKAQQEKSETQKGLKRGDSKTASKTLRAGATDDQVLEKRGQKRDARDTGKSETRLGTAEDEMYKSKDAIGKVAAGENQRSQTGQARDQKEDQALKPGTSRAALGKDASSVNIKEQERMKLEKIKDETTELAPRRVCSKITAKAQQEKSETQKGLKRGDSEAASKTLRAGATDDKVLGKKGQKRDTRDTGKSEARLGTAEDEMYEIKDARGKVAAGENQRSQTGQARDQKENQAFKPGISWAALGKDASSVNVKEQERMKLENIKVAGKEKRKADSDLEQMGPSESKLQQSRQERAEHPSWKKENCAPHLQKKILSVHKEDFSNNEDAKETVRQKQSRPGKELLYTEEGKMLRDQSLSEEGRKRKPSSVGGRPSKRGSPGRDAFEDPAGSRSKSVRVSIHSDSSHKIETRKSRGQSENLKKSSQSQRKSSSQHPNGADDGQTLHDKVSIREGASRMSPRSVRGLKELGKNSSDGGGSSDPEFVVSDGNMEHVSSSSEEGTDSDCTSSCPATNNQRNAPTPTSLALQRQEITVVLLLISIASVDCSPYELDKTESAFRGSRPAASIRDSVSSGRGKGSLSMPKAYPSILYRLSEQEFIDSGWTILPSKTTPQKLVTYQATGAKIPCFWVCPKEDTTVEGNMEKMLYKNGKTFAIFYSNGNIKVFYPNGKQAIIIKRDKKGCFVTIMSPGGKNEKGTYMQPVTVGTFDSLGHGVIYNDYGDVRLAYNQEGGTYYETPHGRNIKWRWPISFAINFIKAHFSELCENKSRNAETLLHIRDLLAAKDKRDTKESRSSGARKEISPAKQPSPAKEISAAKQPSPAKEPSPVKEISPAKQSSPAKEISPAKQPSPAKEISPAKQSSPAKEISPAKQSSPAKEMSSGSPGGRESSNEIKRAGSFGSPKKSPYKEHIENSPEKKESTSTNIKESNRSKRRFQQEDTLSFSPLYMPPAIAACKMDEVEARAERKRQNLLNKAMNVAASCTPMSIIVLKINSFLGFRLLDQAAISIQFTAQDRFVRLELGVQIDPMAKPQVQMVEPSLLNSCVPAQLLCLQKKSH